VQFHWSRGRWNGWQHQQQCPKPPLSTPPRLHDSRLIVELKVILTALDHPKSALEPTCHLVSRVGLVRVDRRRKSAARAARPASRLVGLLSAHLVLHGSSGSSHPLAVPSRPGWGRVGTIAAARPTCRRPITPGKCEAERWAAGRCGGPDLIDRVWVFLRGLVCLSGARGGSCASSGGLSTRTPHGGYFGTC